MIYNVYGVKQSIKQNLNWCGAKYVNIIQFLSGTAPRGWVVYVKNRYGYTAYSH